MAFIAGGFGIFFHGAHGSVYFNLFEFILFCLEFVLNSFETIVVVLYIFVALVGYSLSSSRFVFPFSFMAFFSIPNSSHHGSFVITDSWWFMSRFRVITTVFSSCLISTLIHTKRWGCGFLSYPTHCRNHPWRDTLMLQILVSILISECSSPLRI